MLIGVDWGSTWMIGQPVEQDLREALGGREVRAVNDTDRQVGAWRLQRGTWSGLVVGGCMR